MRALIPTGMLPSSSKGELRPEKPRLYRTSGRICFLIVVGTSIRSYCRQGVKRRTVSSCDPFVATALPFDYRNPSAKARRLVRVAKACDVTDDAEGVAHHAYYAMYNAATTVLLAREGEYPKTHSALVGRFGLAVKDLPGTARGHGRALREAYELRLLADYDAGASGLADRAKASLDAAASFIKFCQMLIKGSGTRNKIKRR